MIASSSPLPRRVCLGLGLASSFLSRPRFGLRISALVFRVPASLAPVECIFSHRGLFVRPRRARFGDKLLCQVSQMPISYVIKDSSSSIKS